MDGHNQPAHEARFDTPLVDVRFYPVGFRNLARN